MTKSPEVRVEILLLHGPNLNLLGQREPERYGRSSLADVEQLVRGVVEERFGGRLRATQSNHEGALIDAIHAAGRDGVDGAILNVGAYTHTSIAIRDAILAVRLPFVEVHISNVYAREPFRHTSLLSDIAAGVIVGCGVRGYRLAAEHLCESLAGTLEQGGRRE